MPKLLPVFSRRHNWNLLARKAHAYQGTSYAYQVVPNLDTPANLQIASLAVAQFDIVLKIHADDLMSIRQEASVYRNIGQFDQAKALEQRSVAIDPTNVDAFYVIGIIDWVQAYKNAVAILATGGLIDDGVGNTKMTHAVCDALVAKNKVLVDDAIASLTKAIELKSLIIMTPCNTFNSRIVVMRTFSAENR
jgi:tetratricopeptide (TPR) repeat protein